MRWHLLSRVSGSLIYSTSPSSGMDLKRHIRELSDFPEPRTLGGRERLWDCEVFSLISHE